MTKRASGWRDRAAVDLVLDHLPYLDVEPPVLVMEDPHDEELAAALARRAAPAESAEGPVDSGASPSAGDELRSGARVRMWRRRAVGGRPASPWPPEAPGGSWRTAFLRLPRAKDELEMAVHGAAERVGAGGRLFVYGAKDEGAGSAARRIEPLLGEVRTVGTGGRCRLLEAERPAEVAGLKAGLEEWRVESEPPHPDLPHGPWVSYPGVFSAGRLDDGTALLLEHLPELPTGGGGEAFRVLDFGCGDGVVAGVVAARWPGVRPTMLDVDTVALAAAAENVPAGRTVAGDGIGAVGTSPPFDAVVSNPPYHRGKAETLEVVEELVRGAAPRLAPTGTLTMVVQRRLPVDRALYRAFASVQVVADRGPFRVWRAADPRTAR